MLINSSFLFVSSIAEEEDAASARSSRTPKDRVGKPKAVFGLEWTETEVIGSGNRRLGAALGLEFGKFDGIPRVQLGIRVSAMGAIVAVQRSHGYGRSKPYPSRPSPSSKITVVNRGVKNSIKPSGPSNRIQMKPNMTT